MPIQPITNPIHYRVQYVRHLLLNLPHSLTTRASLLGLLHRGNTSRCFPVLHQMDMEDSSWTTGDDATVSHVAKIASGAYGEVHKVNVCWNPANTSTEDVQYNKI
jgi:hypothetical protein